MLVEAGMVVSQSVLGAAGRAQKNRATYLSSILKRRNR